MDECESLLLGVAVTVIDTCSERLVDSFDDMKYDNRNDWLTIESLKVGTDEQCSPGHMMPFKSRYEVQNAFRDVASTMVVSSRHVTGLQLTKKTRVRKRLMTWLALFNSHYPSVPTDGLCSPRRRMSFNS